MAKQMRAILMESTPFECAATGDVIVTPTGYEVPVVGGTTVKGEACVILEHDLEGLSYRAVVPFSKILPQLEGVTTAISDASTDETDGGDYEEDIVEIA